MGDFGPLKRIMAAKLEPLLQTKIAHLDKAEWTGCFAAAHAEAFTTKNIKAEFCATCIYPFLPSKLLRRTPTLEPEPEMATRRVHLPLASPRLTSPASRVW